MSVMHISMEQSTDETQPDASQSKTLAGRTRSSEVTCSQEAINGIDCGDSRSQEATDNSHRFSEKEVSRTVSLEKFHQKEEECEKLKEEKRVLKQRLNHILAKAMESHKFSENLNDPCRLSAVLEMYDRLKTHEWEKAKCAARASGFSMTYKDGSTIIKAVFSTCEEELSQKMNQISELLEIPFWKETTSQQLPPGLIKDIKNHIKLLYFNYEEQIYCTRSKAAAELLLHFAALFSVILCKALFWIWGSKAAHGYQASGILSSRT
nr:uncharacterized protein LOC106731810 isoform X2 [Pelodiscus sinensis]|eukprot:XP_014427710.1 uncharacterized protein LOC106731810 isoform X2 [Pelodiscus sinensis]